MTIHHQDNSYLTTEQLINSRHKLSQDQKKLEHIIDRQTISDINSIGLKRFKARLNKTNLLKLKLQGVNHGMWEKRQ